MAAAATFLLQEMAAASLKRIFVLKHHKNQVQHPQPAASVVEQQDAAMASLPCSIQLHELHVAYQGQQMDCSPALLAQLSKL